MSPIDKLEDDRDAPYAVSERASATNRLNEYAGNSRTGGPNLTAADFVTTRFDDVDAFSAWETGMGWEIESTQVSAGRGGIVFDHVAWPGMLVGRFGSVGTMHNTFVVPDGIVVILVCRRMLPVFWSGQELPPDLMPIIRPGNEHFSHIPQGWDSYEFMISVDLIRSAELLPSRFLDSHVRVEDSWLVLPDAARRRFVAQLDRVFGIGTNGTRNGIPATSFGQFRYVIDALRRLVGASSASMNGSAPRATRRADLVRRGQDLMRDRRGESMTVDEICQTLGVSYRVLNYAFQDAYGTSPGQFFRLLKLNEARRLLKSTDITVTSAASQVGVYELGRFAAAYRTHFGELPSDTRRFTSR